MSDAPHTSAFTAASEDADSETQTVQELPRSALKATLTNAIDHARMAQRVVAVLIIVLARSDHLEALLGIPTSQIMQRAIRRIVAVLRPADHFVQLSDEKLCVILPNLRSDALPLKLHSALRETSSPFARLSASPHFRRRRRARKNCLSMLTLPSASRASVTLRSMCSKPMIDAPLILTLALTLNCAKPYGPINCRCFISQKLI